MQDEAIQPPGSTVKQFSVMLQNRVGALSALLGLLDMHGIFCLGFPRTSRGVWMFCIQRR